MTDMLHQQNEQRKRKRKKKTRKISMIRIMMNSQVMVDHSSARYVISYKIIFYVSITYISMKILGSI